MFEVAVSNKMSRKRTFKHPNPYYAVIVTTQTGKFLRIQIFKLSIKKKWILWLVLYNASYKHFITICFSAKFWLNANIHIYICEKEIWDINTRFQFHALLMFHEVRRDLSMDLIIAFTHLGVKRKWKIYFHWR